MPVLDITILAMDIAVVYHHIFSRYRRVRTIPLLNLGEAKPGGFQTPGFPTFAGKVLIVSLRIHSDPLTRGKPAEKGEL